MGSVEMQEQKLVDAVLTVAVQCKGDRQIAAGARVAVDVNNLIAYYREWDYYFDVREQEFVLVH